MIEISLIFNIKIYNIYIVISSAPPFRKRGHARFTTGPFIAFISFTTGPFKAFSDQ